MKARLKWVFMPSYFSDQRSKHPPNPTKSSFLPNPFILTLSFHCTTRLLPLAGWFIAVASRFTLLISFFGLYHALSPTSKQYTPTPNNPLELISFCYCSRRKSEGLLWAHPPKCSVESGTGPFAKRSQHPLQPCLTNSLSCLWLFQSLTFDHFLDLMVLLVSVWFISVLSFISFLPSVWSAFSNFLRWKLGLLIWDLSSFKN